MENKEFCTDKSVCEIQRTVESGSTDASGRLRLSGIMKLQQDVGEEHLQVFRTPSEMLRREFGVAFVFTKIRIDVNRLPVLGEAVTVKTWCSSRKGIRFTRNYVVSLQSTGEILTQSKAEVTVIDLNSRRILRHGDISAFEAYVYNDTLENGCEYPAKLPVGLPESAGASVFRRLITDSDIDFNGHVNNTVYADIVSDCLPDGMGMDRIRCFEINFSNEVKPRETIETAILAENDAVTAVGSVGDRHSFTARLTFG